MSQGPILIADEVRDALAHGRPVVALETAVLTHGLPREPATALPPVVADHPDFAVGVPLNLSLSLAMERAVRTHGAVPATIASSTAHSGSAARAATSNASPPTAMRARRACVIWDRSVPPGPVRAPP